jgi:hypothetical protein
MLANWIVQKLTDVSQVRTASVIRALVPERCHRHSCILLNTHIHARTRAHTHTDIYIYIYVCVCVCVYFCAIRRFVDYEVEPVLHIKQGFSTGVPRNPRVPREIVIEKKNKHRFLNLLAKINRSTEKYNSLLKRALTIIIGSTTYWSR